LQVPAVLSRSPAQDGAVQIVSAGYIAQPPKPSQLPVRPQVGAPWSGQAPRGSGSPGSTGQQVPSRPTWLQATQAPLQATLQHTPSLQDPDAQSVFFAHTAPRGLGPQLPFTHRTPLTQSPSALHEPKHLFDVASQLKGAQTVAGPGLHRPAASQTFTLFTAAPSQAPALQTVPGVYLRHPPAPLHAPSSPQVDTSDLGQTLAARGGRPVGTNAHVPNAAGMLQALQVSPHALLQQTPSTQNPLPQSPPQPQA
jgi:hypothetical protein